MTHLISTPAAVTRIAADSPINTPIAHRHVAITTVPPNAIAHIAADAPINTPIAHRHVAITTVPPNAITRIAAQTTPVPRPDREGGLTARRPKQ